MTENKKPELEYVAPILEGFNNEDYLVTNIDLGKDNTRFSIAVSRVRVDQATDLDDLNQRLIDSWGEQCDLQAMIDNGLKQLSTRPNFKAAAADAIASGDWSEAHKLAQSAMSDYRPGRKATTGTTAKATIAKAKALTGEARDLGFDNLDDMLAKVKLLKEQGLI